MKKIDLVFVALIWHFCVYVDSFPISRLSTKSKVKDNDLQERELFTIDLPSELHKKELKKEGNNRYPNPSDAQPPDGRETPMPKGNLGLRLFPEFVSVSLQSTQTEKPIIDRIIHKLAGKEAKKGNDASITREVKFRASKATEASDVSSENESERKIGGVIPTSLFTEKTVSLPRLKTDFLGNWVHNPWDVTYGPVFRDTRYKGGVYSETMLFARHDISDPYGMYKKKVCRFESTIYNTPSIRRYLKKPYYHFVHKSQGFNLELRKELYEKGNSEECHVPEQIHWQTYTECALMRNMRMEYLIPYYPLHQTIGDWDYVTYFNHFKFDTNPHDDYLKYHQIFRELWIEKLWTDAV